jgi:hypothetical protein
MSASDQFFYIVTKANSSTELLVSFISLLFSAVEVCWHDCGVVGAGIWGMDRRHVVGRGLVCA